MGHLSILLEEVNTVPFSIFHLKIHVYGMCLHVYGMCLLRVINENVSGGQESARKGLNSTSGAQFAALPLVKPIVLFARTVVTAVTLSYGLMTA